MIFVNDELVEFGRYPNGEAVVPKLEAEYPITVRLHWESDEDLVRLALVRGLIAQEFRADDNLKQPGLLVDYMPYSRMDRIQDGHCFSLRYVAEFIRELKWRSIRVVEPHSEATLRLLGKDASAHDVTMQLLSKVLVFVGFNYDADYVVLPDAGAYDRYFQQDPTLFDTTNLVIMKKKRDFATGKIDGIEVDYRLIRGSRPPTANAKAVIIDDLSSRGGTFVGAATLLRDDLACDEVYLLVTHMEPVGYEGSLGDSDLFTGVYCTDTMTPPAKIPDNFHIFQRSDWA